MKGEMTKMQTSFNIQDGTGSELLEQLNNAFKSLATNNSGGTEPEETYGGMFWLDTSQTNKILKQRTADNTAWITFGEIDENGLFHSANTLASDDESVTKKGNIFNAANKLVLLNEQGALPELDGSLLTLPTKATTSLDNLTDSGKAKFDSKWASNSTQIFANANLSSSTYSEYTLDFLPDNGEYELMCNYNITPGVSNGYVRLYLADESETFVWLNGLNSNTNYNTQLQGSSIVVIKNKKIKAKKAAGGNGNERFSLTVIAYRKLGVGFATTNESEVTQDE